MIRPGYIKPLLVTELAVGIVGFLLSLSWGRQVGRSMDRDTVFFLVKFWVGLIGAFFLLTAILYFSN